MNNPMLLQKAIRQNSNDLLEFSKDLKNWGEDMKRKEETLKKGKQETPVPPKVHKKLKGPMKSKAPVSRIGGTDYAAWDKFDADAEMERLEDDLKDDSDLTDECNENMYDEAIVEKEKGNKFVKNQEWEQAIKCYTKAIDCYSYDPIFYANRALCYLKLSKYEEAENDCNLSLKLDDTYVKAYQRRAAARMMLNKLEHAEVDLQKVLIMEPNNKESKAELLKLSVVLKRDREKPDQRPVSKFTASRNKSNSNNFNTIKPVYIPPKEQYQAPEKKIDDSKPTSIWSSSAEIIEVKPVKKPPHTRSKKPLKRVEITEIDGIGVETKTNPSIVEVIDTPIKQHVLEKQEIVKKPQEEPFKQSIVENTDEESRKPISAFKKQKSDKFVEPETNNFSLPKPESKLSCLRTEDLKVIEKLEPWTTPKDIKNTVNDNKKLTEINDAIVQFDYPRTSVQFYTSWKNFKTTTDKYKYLKAIEPHDIPKLFLNSLDSAIFSSILDILVKHFIENKDPIFNILNYFTEVKRFGAIAMFMSSDDKKNLWKLLDYMNETKEMEKPYIERLIKKYEL